MGLKLTQDIQKTQLLGLILLLVFAGAHDREIGLISVIIIYIKVMYFTLYDFQTIITSVCEF